MSRPRTLIVAELLRTPDNGPEDRLILTPGVNVLVGPPNAGKTKWLQMLDYLLGNDDNPVDAFGDDLATKYYSVAARLARFTYGLLARIIL